MAKSFVRQVVVFEDHFKKFKQLKEERDCTKSGLNMKGTYIVYFAVLMKEGL